MKQLMLSWEKHYYKTNFNKPVFCVFSLRQVLVSIAIVSKFIFDLWKTAPPGRYRRSIARFLPRCKYIFSFIIPMMNRLLRSLKYASISDTFILKEDRDAQFAIFWPSLIITNSARFSMRTGLSFTDIEHSGIRLIVQGNSCIWGQWWIRSVFKFLKSPSSNGSRFSALLDTKTICVQLFFERLMMDDGRTFK